MTLPLLVRDEAEADLVQAVLWYEAQRAGLGYELLSEVEGAYAVIQERPRSFPHVTRKTRRALLRRFPYAIYFQLKRREIVVTTIIHTARAPSVWKRRSR